MHVDAKLAVKGARCDLPNSDVRACGFARSIGRVMDRCRGQIDCRTARLDLHYESRVLGFLRDLRDHPLLQSRVLADRLHLIRRLGVAKTSIASHMVDVQSRYIATADGTTVDKESWEAAA